MQLCKRYEIPCFVIHDWDLDDFQIDVSAEPTDSNKSYTSLSSQEKAEYTKNHKIYSESDGTNLHCNKRNLETVLGLSVSEKKPSNVYERVRGKDMKKIKSEFPGLLSDELLSFIGIPRK